MIAIPFYFLSAVGLIILRFREPTTLRPFKNWIIIPVIFCIVSFFVLIFGAYSSPLQAFISALVLAIGTCVWQMDEKMLLTMKSQLIAYTTSIKSRFFGRKGFFHASSDSLEMNDFAE